MTAAEREALAGDLLIEVPDHAHEKPCEWCAHVAAKNGKVTAVIDRAYAAGLTAAIEVMERDHQGFGTASIRALLGRKGAP